MSVSHRLDNANVLIYSHDSFGLGHLRRCREIAHALVDHYKGLRVLILSGSPIIGSFDFKARVDFVRIPSVVKLYNGDYTSLNEHIDLVQTLSIRESIINHTARVFKPDLFLVDKEPLGLRGEVKSTLELFRGRDTRVVLGLRDIMDEPGALKKEWSKRDIAAVLKNYYDEIWVYGHPTIGNPLDGVGLPSHVVDNLTFTGYIMRHVPDTPMADWHVPSDPYVLVTTGGGGDGSEMIDWVLRAYESGEPIPYPALMVLGPFMSSDTRQEFSERAVLLDNVQVQTFSPNMERVMQQAVAVVAMGGYNTFCEILSFDKKALLVPRSKPRREQLIRAERASERGLVTYLDGDGERSTRDMVIALGKLFDQPLPSHVGIDNMLHGLDTINARVLELIGGGSDEPDASPVDELPVSEVSPLY
ncbi:MAG: membrane protein [marine bacterium B5-7]|nr:MAG: membrane protein [marine bacterium B5-7]